MQFICEKPEHIVVRSDDRDEQGRLIRGGRRRLYAKFQRGGLPPYALQKAIELYEFRGKAPEQPVEGWASFYDSEADQIRMNWSDDERKLIEAHLLSRGHVVVEKEKVPVPYPSYEKHRLVHGQRKVAHAIKDIIAAVEAAGIDPDTVIAYERQEGNNAEVIAALEALRDGFDDPVEEVIAA